MPGRAPGIFVSGQNKLGNPADLNVKALIRSRRSAAPSMKIATFNINNVNKRLANLLAWLRAAKPDVVCLQELKADGSRIPQGCDRKSRLRCRLAGTEIVERRRHSGTRRRTDRDAHRAAQEIRTTRRPATSRPPSMVCLSPRSTRRTAIRSRGRNSNTSSLGWIGSRCTRLNSLLPTFRSSSPATSMSCRPISISIRGTPTPRTRFLRRKLAPGSSAFSTAAGATPFAQSIPTRRCTPIGATCETAGRAMPGCASTICC